LLEALTERDAGGHALPLLQCWARVHNLLSVKRFHEVWVDPVYEIVGVYFSIVLELTDDLQPKECYDLFTNAVTAAVVDA
jgi:hypothetical protein